MNILDFLFTNRIFPDYSYSGIEVCTIFELISGTMVETKSK